MENDLLTVRQVAERLRVSLRTIWTWIGAGRVRALKLGPRVTRVEIAEVERLIEGARARAGRAAGGRTC